MVTVYFIRANNEKVRVEVSEGTTLMQAAKEANIREIPADCGGSCACATCHIYVHTRIKTHIMQTHYTNIYIHTGRICHTRTAIQALYRYYTCTTYV